MRCYTGRHRFYCGVDLHARSLYTHVLDDAGKTVFERDLPADPAAFLDAVTPLRDGLVVGAECMFARYWLADLCEDHGIRFVLGHALYMKMIHGGKAHTGGIASEEEEEQLESLNAWIEGQGLPRGTLAYDFADAVTGEQRAVFDLAWPNGIQEELSPPVAVLLNEDNETVAIASQAGFRCFTETGEFRRYVSEEIVAADPRL